MTFPDLRADFPVLERVIDGNRVVYLDSAATSLKPRTVIEAVTSFYSKVGANIHRGKHYLSEEASHRFEQVRAQTGQFLRVPSNQVVFTSGTTQGLNLVAAGLSLGPEDLVVGSLDAHHSQLLPWRARARLALTRLGPDGRVDLEHFQALLRERPRVVALTHCSNVTGLYAPLAKMSALAKQAGALVVVDAAQSIPHGRLPEEADADFVVFSGHKMLAPTGTGVLYGRAEALERLAPSVFGGGTVDWADVEGQTLRKVPQRLEAGTPNISGVYGLGAALEYLERLGCARIAEHDRTLSAVLLAEARARPYLKVLGGADQPAGDRAAVLSVALEGVDKLDEVARMLSDSYGVMCRSGHLCAQPLVDSLTPSEVLRISAYLYNSEEEIRSAFSALDEIYSSLGVGQRASASRGAR